MNLLKGVAYFSELDDAALEGIARSAVCQVYDGGQVVLLEGEPSAGLYFVESGWLKAIKIGIDGREQVLERLGPGRPFNAISVFTDAPAQATVTALESAKVWVVQKEVLLKTMDEYPALARQVVKDLASKVMHLVQMVEDLSLRSVEARLARLLLEQAVGEVLLRQRWDTQSEMAARLGTVPDMVNRALRKLVEDRLILVERHQIQILDREGLKVAARVMEE
jgi:CRP/FNR family transcriptional regulator